MRNIYNSLRSKVPNEKLEWVFVCIFLFFGFIFISITPPGQNPDEFTHVYRAVQVSDGKLVPEKYVYEKREYIGGDISSSLNTFFDKWHTFSAYSDVNFRFNAIEDLKTTKNLKEDRSQTTKTDFNNTAVYSPLAYIPQVIAVFVSRVVDAPLILMVLLGRVLGLLTVAAAFFLAIRIIPVGRWAVFVIGLLPATVSQAAAFSADAMTISAVLVGISYILRVSMQKKVLANSQFVLLFALCSLIGIVKPSYLPIICLVLLIPLLNKKMRTKKLLRGVVLVTGLSLIPFIIWMQEISFIKTVHSDFNPTADYSRQLDFVISNPAQYVFTIYQTFFTTQQNNTYRALFGDFGWNYAPLPPLFVFVSIVLLVLSVVVQSPRDLRIRMTDQQLKLFRIILIGVFCLCVLLISTALYLSFNNLKRTSIDGVQGRYLTPPLILLLLAFYGNKLQKQTFVKKGIVIVSCFVLFAGIVTAFVRYYINIPPFYN